MIPELNSNFYRFAQVFGTRMKRIHFVKTLMVADFILIVLLYMIRFAQTFLEHRLDRLLRQFDLWSRVNRFAQIFDSRFAP